jgi:DNA-binding transcriptional ArsR family regulator
VSPLTLITDPTRAEILRLTWTKERSAGEIAAGFAVTFGAVSQHLARLREAGLVAVRRDGKRRLYRANPQALGPLVVVLEQMWASQLTALKDLAEAEQKSVNKHSSRRSRHARPRRRC